MHNFVASYPDLHVLLLKYGILAVIGLDTEAMSLRCHVKML